MSPRYRLKIVDSLGGSYCVLESKQVLTNVMEEFKTMTLQETWLTINGFSDEASLIPMVLMVKRDNIAGMLLSKV